MFVSLPICPYLDEAFCRSPPCELGCVGVEAAWFLNGTSLLLSILSGLRAHVSLPDRL